MRFPGNATAAFQSVGALDPQSFLQLTQVAISITQTVVFALTIWYFVRQVELLRKTLWAAQGSEYIKEMLAWTGW
jgi:hypothetical protein